jgi:hypothetical protein
MLLLFRVAFVPYTGTYKENGTFDLQQFGFPFPSLRSSMYNNNKLKHEIKELQTTAILATAHILLEVLM